MQIDVSMGASQSRDTSIADISELVLAWAHLTGRSPHKIIPAPFGDTIHLPRGITDLHEWRFEKSHDVDYLDWMPFRIEDTGMCQRIAYVNTNQKSSRYHHLLVIQYWCHNGPIIKQEFDGDATHRQLTEHVLVPGWIRVDDVNVYYWSDGRTWQFPVFTQRSHVCHGLQAGA